MIGNNGMLLKLTWDIEVVGNLQEMAVPEGGFIVARQVTTTNLVCRLELEFVGI